MGEDWGQWEGECGRGGSRRFSRQRDDEEAGRRAIGVSEERCITVIGIRYGNQ